ncbi:hypothetical protein ETD85_48835 [Nonomuraea zeae]|uniref:Uncharacterized protein n=2 Tax=Nonomuraea zeae TaxID=1642303 RepID=A0A5S4FQJ3_9ACTN|nr:hypothetical protein ETD85_48835 [Nonomuraea zeae]
MGDIKAVRAYLRSRGRTRASLLDQYATGFGLAMVIVILGRPVSGVVSGLAGPVDPARMGAGAALLALGLIGFLASARAAGPVLLPAPDASWLLLSPLHRRRVLGRAGRALAVVAVVAGLVLGLGLVAVLGAPDLFVWRLLGALALGVSVTAGGMALAVLGQASQSWQVWVTATMVGLLVLAVVAVSGQARSVLAVAASAPLPALAGAVSGAAVLSGLLVRQAWSSLDRIPSRTLLAASTRAGHVANAAVALDPGALAWIAEDNHWRARKLRSRRWPALPAPLALAWHDWRRLARRPGRLATMLATAALPAVLAQAGGAPAALGAAVLAGALAVAATSTAGARRDSDNPSLARLLGVGHRKALAARAVLPLLLSGAWATLALSGLMITGGLAGSWWLLGVPAAPALAAGALRMAGRRPVDHSMPVIDTPGGAIPTGPLIWALTGVDLAALGCLPVITALLYPPAGLGGYLAAQAVTGVLVLVGYVMRARPGTTAVAPGQTT